MKQNFVAPAFYGQRQKTLQPADRHIKWMRHICITVLLLSCTHQRLLTICLLSSNELLSVLRHVALTCCCVVAADVMRDRGCLKPMTPSVVLAPHSPIYNSLLCVTSCVATPLNLEQRRGREKKCH